MGTKPVELAAAGAAPETGRGGAPVDRGPPPIVRRPRPGALGHVLEVTASVAVVLLLAAAGYVLERRESRFEDRDLLPPLPPASSPGGPRLLTIARDSPKLSLVKTQVAARRELPLEVRVPAKIQVDGDRVAHLSAPVSGRIVEVHARPGQRVAKGETLFVVDSPDVGAAQADVVKAEAELEVQRKNVARENALAAREVVSRQELEQALADLAKAQAEERRARERLEALGLPEETKGQRVPVSAPFEGSVIERQANLGEFVRNDSGLQQVLATIADLSTVWVVGDLPESALASAPDLATFGTGKRRLPVSVEVPALDETFRGTLDYVSDTVDPITVTVHVQATLPNDERRLRPEMGAVMTIELDGDRATQLAVPEKAIVSAGSHEVVVVARGPGVFERREVVTGRRGHGFVAVEKGLDEGERVVVDGALFLEAELEAARD